VSSEAAAPQHAPQIPRLTGPVLALSGLSLTAGTIHLVAILQHLDVYWTLPVFFGVLAAGQLYLCWAYYRWPDDRRLLLAGAVGNFAVALLWLVSRTVGVPFGPEEGTQGIGVSDTIASLQEFAFAAVAFGLVRDPESMKRRLAWLGSPMGLRFTFMILPALLFTAALGGHKH
jgi:hypothetical protein